MKYHVLLELPSNEVVCIEESFMYYRWFLSLSFLSLDTFTSGESFSDRFQDWLSDPEKYNLRYLFSFTAEEFSQLQQLYPEHYI